MPSRRYLLFQAAAFSSAGAFAAKAQDAEVLFEVRIQRLPQQNRKSAEIRLIAEVSFSPRYPVEHTVRPGNAMETPLSHLTEDLIFWRGTMGLLNLDSIGLHAGGQAVLNLYVYYANSESLSPIYSDSNLTDMQPNPIAMRPGERLPLCFLTEGDYRLVIRDRRNRVVQDLNNVSIGSYRDGETSKRYRCLPDLLEDRVLSYESSASTQRTVPGDMVVVSEGNFRYSVAAKDASDFHLETQGGVKLRVRPENGKVPVDAFVGGYDSALANAIQVAAKETACVVHDASRVYQSIFGVDIKNSDVRVDFNGAKVERAGENKPFLNISFDYQDVTAVQAIEVSQVDFGGGQSACQCIVVDMNSQILSNLKVGDIVKVVSDQRIPSSPVADNERLGEAMEVVALDVVKGHIVCMGLLREAFSILGNNVRVARAGRGCCTINGLNATSTSLYEPIVRVTGATRPILELEVDGGFCPALELLSCYRPKVEVKARGLVTDPSKNKFGYGVVSYGCKNGHYNVLAERVRHAWTSGARGVSEVKSSQIERFGGSIDEYVFLDAADCYGPAFDTHPDALGTVARGIIRNAFPGGDTSNTCFQVRGRSCDVDITTIGLRAGRVGIYGNEANHRICVNHRRPKGYDLITPIFEVSGETLGGRGEVWLDLKNRSESGQAPIIDARNCKLVVTNFHSQDARTGNGSLRPCVINAESAHVEIGNWLVDWDSSDGNLTPALARLDSDSKVVFYEGRVARGNGKFFLADLRNQSGDISFRQIETDLKPMEPVNASLGTWDVRELSVLGLKLQDVVAFKGDADSKVDVLGGRVLKLNELLTAERRISLPERGIRAGHRFRFVRPIEIGGSFPWTVVGGSSSFPLRGGESISLLYDGIDWIRV